jgi:cytochrome b561
MPFEPVASILIFGLPLAIYLGAATLVSLLATATIGMLVLREGSDVPFTWHVNMARLTIVIALIHALVVYWTFF